MTSFDSSTDGLGLTPKDWKVFSQVDRALSRGGFQAMLVGGAVRDHLLGVEVKDLDFAVNCEPTRANTLMLDMGHFTIPTGIKHGTFTAIVDGVPVEITSLRIDKETDGRHAVVEFTSDWRADAERRDLTINSMFMDIKGKILDFFGGQDDLRAGTIRFVGEPRSRIEEDYLRILRYFRFMARFSGSAIVDRTTINAITHSSKGLEKISGERIWSELTKIFSGPNRVDVASVMHTCYIFDAVSPLLEYDHHMMCRLESSSRTKSPLYFIASMIPNASTLDRLRERLRFDTNSYRIMRFLIEEREKDTELTKEAVDVAIALGESPELLYHYAVFSFNEGIAEYLEGRRNAPPVKFPVSGNDLKDAGVKPGAGLGVKLNELKARWAASNHTMTREELLRHVSPD